MPLAACPRIRWRTRDGIAVSCTSKSFRAWDMDQTWLPPPSVHEFVPARHLAHFVRDTVRETSSSEGDVVIAPFCGCGTAVHAAEKLGRR